MDYRNQFPDDMTSKAFVLSQCLPAHLQHLIIITTPSPLQAIRNLDPSNSNTLKVFTGRNSCYVHLQPHRLALRLPQPELQNAHNRTPRGRSLRSTRRACCPPHKLLPRIRCLHRQLHQQGPGPTGRPLGNTREQCEFDNGLLEEDVCVLRLFGNVDAEDAADVCGVSKEMWAMSCS